LEAIIWSHLHFFMSLGLYQWLIEAKQHAPTVEQCQADQKVWLSKLESHPIDGSLPDLGTLMQWSQEMLDWEEVDPQHHCQYYNLRGELGFLEAMRYGHFLERHGLWRSS
jgi:hypothetical protein